MNKIILMLALSAGAITAVPRPVAAECTTEYVRCLNDSYYYSGMLKRMADISCFASYVGCLRRSV